MKENQFSIEIVVASVDLSQEYAICDADMTTYPLHAIAINLNVFGFLHKLLDSCGAFIKDGNPGLMFEFQLFDYRMNQRVVDRLWLAVSEFVTLFLHLR